jgi:hypothetical protein
MKSLYWTVVCVFIIRASPFAAPDVDHLLPPEMQQFSKYYELLSSKLGVTEFNCGRVFVIPSFDPEYSVSVYREPSNGGRTTYYVTYVVAASNLSQRTDTGVYPEKGESVKTRRIDAAIPEHVAELVRQVWQRMLTGSQRPRPTPTPSRQMIAFDGTLVDFSLERPNATQLSGELDVSIPPPGRKTKELVALARLLVSYCQANPAERPSIAKRIDHKANELLAALK